MPIKSNYLRTTSGKHRILQYFYKRYSLFIILILFTIKLNGQTYFPFPTMDNTIWSVYHSVGEPGVCEELIWFEYIFSGDTVISGNSFKKIFVQNLTLLYHHSGFPDCSHPPENGYAGAFREDTVSKKCYVVFPNSANESLIYDFTLSIGDTIYSAALPPYLHCFGVTTLYSIDSIRVNGIYRNEYGYCSNQYRVIEGIGSTNDPFGFSLYLNNSTLHCVRLDTTILYNRSPLTSCTYILSTSNELNNDYVEIEIYPNPTNDKLYVQSNFQIERIEILDLYSKTIFTTLVSESPISLDGIPKGIFIVKIVAKDKSFFQKRLVVH